MVTLLTDFGDSPYPGQMKGVILSILPGAQVVDISHSIPFAQVGFAAYTLLCSFQDFPPGTVHLCVVDPGVGSERDVLLLHAAGHTFVAPDNGLLWPLWERFSGSARAFRLCEYKGFCRPLSRTFHGRDVFAPVGAWVARGVPLLTLGEPLPGPRVSLKLPRPQLDGGKVVGEVVFVDPFGNLVTNIEPGCLPGPVGRIRVKGLVIEQVADHYAQWEGRGAGAIVNSCGRLELFIFKGNAQVELGVGLGERIEVEMG